MTSKNELFLGFTLPNGSRFGLSLKAPEPQPTFTRVPVDSSMITTVAHARGEDLLRVEFSNGDEYEYEGVPFSVFKDLAHAESAGAFFNRNVKDKYPTRKLEEV